MHWTARLVERDAGYVTPCLEWQGSDNGKGYGLVVIGGKKWTVHRRAWVEAHGDPGDKHVLHRCDNRRCAREDHLFLGTPIDNARDCREKGRTLRGERANGSRLTESQVRATRRALAAGARNCDLAEQYGVSRSTISLIKTGRNWKLD